MTTALRITKMTTDITTSPVFHFYSRKVHSKTKSSPVFHFYSRKVHSKTKSSRVFHFYSHKVHSKTKCHSLPAKVCYTLSLFIYYNLCKYFFKG